MEDSVFIKVMEYGDRAGLEGTTLKELVEWAFRTGIIDRSDINKDQKKISLENVFNECFDEAPNIHKAENRRNLKAGFSLQLKEYHTCQEVRKQAKKASRRCVWAICISITVMLSCLILTWISLDRPISTVKSDSEIRVYPNSPPDTQRVVKLDPVQMEQILSAIDENRPQGRKSISIPSNEAKHHELINRYFEDE